MKRVTGLGGVFFKTSDPKKVKEWYKKHLNIDQDTFKWKDLSKPDAKEPALTVWSPFKDTTDYFAPSEKSYMFNYRVEDLRGLLAVLKEEGVTIVGEIQEESYGLFGWIMDCDGNKIELWEPKDEGF